jgi:hypothetical protein
MAFAAARRRRDNNETGRFEGFRRLRAGRG